MGASIDAIYFCPHGPQDRCACRKPKPTLARRAVKDLDLTLKGSAVIGDKRADVDLGRRLGITSIFILTGHGRSQKKIYGKNLKPTHTTRNLLTAARGLIKSKVDRSTEGPIPQ